MAAYLVQLIIFRFVQIILFKYLLDSTNQMYVIVIDDKRNLIQLVQVAAIFVIQLSMFTILLKKIYLKKYLKWITKPRQSVHPLAGGFILLIPIALYLTYYSVFSGQYNGFSANSLFMNITFFLLGAMAEEFVFRGYFYKLLIRKNRKYTIYLILLQAVIFTYTHVNNPDGNLVRTLNIFLAGILLGLVAIRGFLYAVAFHFLWNFVQAYLLGLSVSGYSFTGSLNTFFDAGSWENNIYCAIPLATGIAVLLAYYFRKKKFVL